VFEYCDRLAAELRDVRYDDRRLEVEVDKREGRGGDKVWSWIKKGVPVYLEIGPRDIASDSVFAGRRDKGRKERFTMRRTEFVNKAPEILADIQNNLFARAKTFQDGNIRTIDNRDEFYEFFTPANKEKPEIHGGFALSHWNGSAAVEERVKNDLNVTIRCIPLDGKPEEGKCVISGEKSNRRVIFAKSY
jgi:prolyl-tRNA synthetase